MSTEELNGDSQNLGGWQKEGIGVFGPAKGAGTHGNGFIRSKGPDFSLELVEHGQSTATSGGMKPTRARDSFAQTDGVGLFMMDAEGGAGLFGKEQFEGVGA